MMATTNNQAVKKAVSLYFTQLRGTKICLRGEDLKELGLKPGRIYTRILDDVLNERLNKKLQSKMDEIEFVKEKYL
jgi:tRNA nucleotidyltransferase (CCA-adding enzyme)